MLLEIVENIETFILDVTTNLYDAISWLGVALMMAIESTAIPLPSEVIMPLAGWRLVLDNDLGIGGIFFAGLIGALGSLIGALVEYWVARWGGRPFIERFGKYVLLSKKDVDRTEAWFKKYGHATVFFIRLVPGVRGLIAIPAGIAKMNVVKFGLLTFLASLPWTTLLAWGGYALGDNYDTISNWLRPFYIPVVAILVIILVIFVWKRIAAIRHESRT